MEEKYLQKKIDEVDSWVSAVAGAYFAIGDKGWPYQTDTHRKISREIEQIVRQVYKHGKKAPKTLPIQA